MGNGPIQDSMIRSHRNRNKLLPASRNNDKSVGEVDCSALTATCLQQQFSHGPLVVRNPVDDQGDRHDQGILEPKRASVG
jgi:hypothetical protein